MIFSLPHSLMKIGYARVSTAGQHLDTQIEKLTTFGCEKIYEEKQCGKASDNRRVLQDALKFAREGDTFVITRIDRLARSLLDLIKIAESFEKQSIGFVVLDQQIDTTTPTGRLMFHVLSAIGEFERCLIDERTI
jgi:DNA invertase Pin-like site-specific DNA recombinase